MCSFYLQRNIYNIYTTENSLEHVVPVASLHRHVRLHVCSTVSVCVCVCLRPTACRFCVKAGELLDVSHIVHLYMRTATYTTIVNHRRPPAHQTVRPRVHCSRPPRRVVQRLSATGMRPQKYKKNVHFLVKSRPIGETPLTDFENS